MNIVIKLNKKFAQGIIQGGIVCLTSDYSTTATYNDFESNQLFSYLPGLIYDEGTISQDIDITDGPSLSNPVSFDFSLLDATGDWTQLLKTNPTIGGEVIITTDGIWGSSENVITDIVSISINNNIVSFKTEDRKRFVNNPNPTFSNGEKVELVFERIDESLYTDTVDGIPASYFRAHEISDNRVLTTTDAFGIKYYNLPSPGIGINFLTDNDLLEWDHVFAELEIVEGPGTGEKYLGFTWRFGNAEGKYSRRFFIDSTTFRNVPFNNETQLPDFTPNNVFKITKKERIYNLPTGVSFSDIENVYVDRDGYKILIKPQYFEDNGNGKILVRLPYKITENHFFRPSSASNDVYGNLSTPVYDNSLTTYQRYTTEAEANGGLPFTLNFNDSKAAIKSIKDADLYLVAGLNQAGQIIDHLTMGWNYQYRGVYQVNKNYTLTSAQNYDGSKPHFWTIPTNIISGSFIDVPPYDYFEEERFKLPVKSDDIDLIGFIRMFVCRNGINMSNGGENYLDLYAVGLVASIEQNIEDNQKIYIDIKPSGLNTFQNVEWYALKQFGIWHNVCVSTDVLGSSIASLDYMIPAGRNYFPLGREIAHDCFNTYVDFSSYAYNGLSAIGYKKQLRGIDFYQRLDEMSQHYIFNEDMLLKDSVSDLGILRGSFINSPKIIWSDSVGVNYYFKFKNVDQVTSAFPSMSDNWKSFIDTDYDLSQLVNVETFYNNAKTAFDFFRTSYIETDLLIEREVKFVAFRDIESIFSNHATRLFRYISKVKKEITFKSNVFVSLGLRVRLNHISILGNSWLYGFITSKTYNVASRLIEYTVQIDYVTQNFDIPELIENELTYTSQITNANDTINDQLLNYGSYDTFNGQL